MPNKHDHFAKPATKSEGLDNLSSVISPASDKQADHDKVSTKNVDIWFQSAYRTQLELTSLADIKANIMISINGLIITGIVATQELVQFAPQLHRLIPILIMLTCMISMVFAVIAALPRGRSNPDARKEHEQGKGNLLYFNNQSCFREDEFEQAVIEILGDPEQLQRQMARHLYNLGCVLARKYRLLKISYSVFLAGLILAVILSTVSFLIK